MTPAIAMCRSTAGVHRSGQRDGVARAL